jgi:uncharacterized phage-associated protein
MAKVLQVAEYFLTHNKPTERGPITPLKLQKLAYYAQGHALATLGRPLFEELMHAWEDGPVCASLYHRFKNFEAAPLDYMFETAAEERRARETARKPFSSEEIDLMDNILACYGDYTAWTLRRMSHETTPWRKSFPGRLITRKSMKDFFSAMLKADKVEVVPLTREEADEIAVRLGVGLK